MMKESRHDKFYWAIIILLIIIIVILLYFNRIGQVVDKDYKPNGNVDVFDIDVDCYCEDGCDNKGGGGKKRHSSDTNPDEVVPTFDEDDDEEIFGIVFVDDENGDFIYQQNLKIFTNSIFEYDTMIAPGVSNTYHFVVHNSSDMDLKYRVQMYETSEYKVNLKYRLKRNNEYVIGDDTKWVSANELDISDLRINAGKSDSYSLDWKWDYNGGKDAEDTIAGQKMTSQYKLNVRFNFRQI